MKKPLLLLVLLALGAAGYYFYLHGPRASGFTPEAGYTALYDGKSLHGWRAVGGQSGFTAEGEDIVGRHGPGENTFLRTEKTYADFSLKLQMRWDEPGNSGVMFRAGQRDGDGRVYGYQYELDDDVGRSWSAGIYDEARRGWLAGLQDKPEVRAAIRRDDWNDVEIEARGPQLKTWINGVPAADIIDGLDAEGFIALQVHSGDKGVMRWRHIQIKPLPALAQAGEDLLQRSAWRGDFAKELQFAPGRLSAPLPGEDAWLAPRRQFSDAVVRMTVPACDSPTVVQMRYQADEKGERTSYAEVKIYADRAEARLQTPTGERVLPAVSLQNAAQHRFVGVTAGSAVTLTVDEVDALRLQDTGLPERGQLRIQPARCGESFSLTDLQWFSLREKPGEPQFYQTLDTRPAPVLSPEQALSAFSVAPGFEIELVAAEPLIEEPVAMAWDEYGRLYVVEMRGYMRDAYGTDSDAPVGRVVRLEDSDGDGRMDNSEVFLDGLVSPRAVAVVNEGVLIGEPPNLWLCAVPARNASCEHKQRVGAYADDAAAANVEHMENGLRQGLDNWLYNAKSARSHKLVDGKLVQRNGFNRGQWGISQDDYGRLFYNHNSTWLQADFFAAEDLVQPGEESYPAGLGVNLTDPAEVFAVRVNPGVNRAYIEDTLRDDGRLLHATGVSGLAVYRGDQFPRQYRGNVFVPEVAANVVAQFALGEAGMALSAQHRLYDDARWGKREFLGSTDERFRPVDALNGPDGALYIIDMYHGIVQDDHFLTDELREQVFQRQLDAPLGMGRIWRVRHTQGKQARDFPVLAAASAVQLVAALGDANGWVRDTAQRLLLARKGNLQPALAQVASGDNTIAALHAIWTLQGRGELQRDLVLQLARSGDLQRQLQALRAGHALLQVTDLLALQQELQQPPEALAMQLAFAMAGQATDSNVRAALHDVLIAHLHSAYVRQAVIHAVGAQELPFLREVLASGELAKRSTASEATLQALGASAYRSLRGDLAATEPANPALLDLLALAQARSGELAWQQQALLQGMESVTAATGFVPALLAAAPPLFSDRSIAEDDPLWNARLAAHAAFTWPGDELAAGLQPLTAQQQQQLALGETFYRQCAACHGDSGAGIDGLAPPLAGSSWVSGPPEWLGRIILQGLHGPVTVRDKSFDGVMPAHGHLAELDDATLAGLMTYLRRSWGNKAEAVSADAAAAVRAASAGRKSPWTVAELEAVPYDRGFKRFAGDYTVSFLTLTVSEKPEGLYISAPMYGGGPLQAVNATTFKIDVGGENVKVEFEVKPDGTVNSLVLYRKGEKIPVQRKQ